MSDNNGKITIFINVLVGFLLSYIMREWVESKV